MEWFQDVLDNAPEGYANLNMARVYVNIGSFYRDITTDITEASDKGKYKPFFDNIRELLDTVAADENESDRAAGAAGALPQCAPAVCHQV